MMFPSFKGNFATLSNPFAHIGSIVGEMNIGDGNMPRGVDGFAESNRYVIVSQDGAPSDSMLNILLTPNTDLENNEILQHCKALLHVIVVNQGAFHTWQNYGQVFSDFFSDLIVEVLSMLPYSQGSIDFCKKWGRQEQSHEKFGIMIDAILFSLICKYVQDQDTTAEDFSSWLLTRNAKGRLLIFFCILYEPLHTLKYNVRIKSANVETYFAMIMLTMQFDVAFGNHTYAKLKAFSILQQMLLSPYWLQIFQEFCFSVEQNGEGMEVDRLLEFIHKQVKSRNPRIHNEHTFMSSLNENITAMPERIRRGAVSSPSAVDGDEIKGGGLHEEKALGRRDLNIPMVKLLAAKLSDCGVWNRQQQNSSTFLESPKGIPYSSAPANMLDLGWDMGAQYFEEFSSNIIAGYDEAKELWEKKLAGNLLLPPESEGQECPLRRNWLNFAGPEHDSSSQKRSLSGGVESISAKDCKAKRTHTWQPNTDMQYVTCAKTGKSSKTLKLESGLAEAFAISRFAPDAVESICKIKKLTIETITSVTRFYCEIIIPGDSGSERVNFSEETFSIIANVRKIINKKSVSKTQATDAFVSLRKQLSDDMDQVLSTHIINAMSSHESSTDARDGVSAPETSDTSNSIFTRIGNWGEVWNRRISKAFEELHSNANFKFNELISTLKRKIESPLNKRSIYESFGNDENLRRNTK